MNSIDLNLTSNVYKSISNGIDSLIKRVSIYSNVKIKSYKKGIIIKDEMTTNRENNNSVHISNDIKLSIHFSTNKK
jgi:hypothetical protein